jgi:hypothetical protein
MSLVKTKKAFRFIEWVVIFILLIVLASWIYIRNSGPSTQGEVEVLIRNQTTLPINEVKLQSNLGTSNYTIIIPPGETARLYTYSRSEDHPQVHMIFSNGQFLIANDYVEGGGSIKLKVLDPQTVSHCYGFTWSSCTTPTKR